MGGKTYIGTSQLKKLFVDSTKVKKVFIGTTQVFASAFEFSYSGQCLLNGVICTPNTVYESEGDFVLKFLTSGTLTISNYDSDKNFDIGLVGGGAGGTDGVMNGDYGRGAGAGGSGGEVKWSTNIPLSSDSVVITIGAGSAPAYGETATTSPGGNSTMTGGFTLTALGANPTVQRTAGASRMGGTVGKGADAGVVYGNDGTYMFNDSSFDGIKYGAGGSGGQESRGGYAGQVENSGGTTGGGGKLLAPGSYATQGYWQGAPATANTGSGGGGGSAFWVQGWERKENNVFSGGFGATGVAFIRNHRT